MKKILFQLSLASTLAWTCFAEAPRLHAQGIIWGGEAERYFRPGAFIPNDGQPFSETYGYSTAGSYWYPLAGGNSGTQLNWLDYYDRLDRAYKYGYQVPNPPSPTSHSSGRTRVGLGLGYFRFR